MNKKLISMAVAGALALPAVVAAQNATVNIYGNIHLNYNFVDYGPNLRKVDGFSRYDSYLGFRGEEKISGGLSAWFQCESTLDVSGADSFGGSTNNPGPTGLCDRNSGVGLKGAFGNFFVGEWDTPMKQGYSSKIRPVSSVGLFGAAGILLNGSAGQTGNPRMLTGTDDDGSSRTSFYRRQTRTINYYTPEFSGFQAKFAVSAGNEQAGLNNGVNSGIPVSTNEGKTRLWSAGVDYNNGPLYVAASYERHKNYNPGARTLGAGATDYSGGDDNAWQIAAAYTFGQVFRLGAIYSAMDYEVTNTGDMKTKGFAIYGDWKIQGPHMLRMVYAKAADTKGSASGINLGNFRANGGAGSTGANLWGIQYAYALSKRTEVGVGYAKLNNDSQARHRLDPTGMAVRNPGQDSDGWMLGIKHSF